MAEEKKYKKRVIKADSDSDSEADQPLVSSARLLWGSLLDHDPAVRRRARPQLGGDQHPRQPERVGWRPERGGAGCVV